MDLDAYRCSAESFLSALTEAYYRHYAGLDDEYEIEPIYRRHAELFDRRSVEALRELTFAAPTGSEQRRRLTMLLDFAIEGFLGDATKGSEAELARREASAWIEVDGQRVGFRDSAVLQANEPSAERRGLIDQARLAVTDRQLGALYRELTERRHLCALELGFSSYRECCQESKDIDFAALQAQTAAFSASTQDAYAGVLDPELRRTLGIGLAELRHADLPRFFRAADQDAQFPADRLVQSLLETFGGLAISAQDHVTLDVEARAKKSPRAFCAPVRVPDHVYLVIAPVGGRDDFSALFHEAGHAMHYAHVDPELPFEFRYLGDNTITETFAFLFQHLLEDPVWLERRLAITDPTDLSAYARAHRLVYLRRYAAKLAYELELHRTDGSGGPILAARYAQLLGQALGVSWPTETFLADVDPGFYCACYLRAWALETQLRAYLRERFGPTWFEVAQAGEELRRLWREGQRRRPEELLSELTGEQLGFGVLLSDLELGG